MYQPVIIQTHFDDFWVAKIDKGIHDHDCYNFNKTDFKIGVGQDQQVITKDESDCLNMEDLENREYFI